jgi:hypothetical protein
MNFFYPWPKNTRLILTDPSCRKLKTATGGEIIFDRERRLFSLSTFLFLQGYETQARDRDEVVVPQGDKVLIVHRNRVAENTFIAKLAGSSFQFYRERRNGFACLERIGCVKE